MKKPNFKKIALMGMAGGLIAVTQAVAGTAMTQETTLAAKGCGGSGKCGGRASCGSPVQRNRYTAYNDDADMSTSTSSQTMTESEFLSKLRSENKNTYQQMSSEGQAYALKLANQGTDPNDAVKMAAQQMATKRTMMNGSKDTGYNNRR